MYLSWKEIINTDFSEQNIDSLYNQGFVFTRAGKGIINQTRSVRINLPKFKLSSENKRILKKNDTLNLKIHSLPYSDYHWTISKMAKDFYDTKFGEKTFSANKIKELLTDNSKSNFNKLLVYRLEHKIVGYAICHETIEILHYSYPFYNLKAESQKLTPNVGMGMMVRAILYAQEDEKKYVYLGSAQRQTDTYKLQFDGLEWFDGKVWKTDLKKLKQILKEL